MDDKNSIGPKVRELFFYIRHTMDETISARVKGITPTQGFILYKLKVAECENEELNQKTLEHCLHVNKSTLSEMLNCMEKNGLIERVSSLEDNRIKFIRMTSKGRETNDQIAHVIDELENSFKAQLTSDELDTFFRVIKKIKKEEIK